MKFNQQIDRLLKRYENETNKKAQEILSEVCAAVTTGEPGEQNPVRTGNTVSNWNLGINSIDTSYNPYPLGEDAKAVAERQQIRQAAFLKLNAKSRRAVGEIMYLNNATPYINELEYGISGDKDQGTSPQAPDGWININIKKIKNKYIL